MTTELAAANARAGRLEEVIALALRQGAHADCIRILEAALSTAPQASTEQASPSPAVGEECAECPHPQADHEGGFCKRCECGGYLDARVHPAQPAPGGTERCPGCNSEERGFCGAVELGDGFAMCCHPWHGPTPAEPQGRPEQAGDRVGQLRSAIDDALRSFSSPGDTTVSKEMQFAFRYLADRIVRRLF